MEKQEKLKSLSATKKFALFLAVAMLWVAVANAQRLNVAYVFSTGIDSTQWITLDTSAQSLMSANDIRSTVKDIGFPFYYAGTTQTKFSVNKYGRLRFGTSLVSTISQAYPLGNNSGSFAPGVAALPRYHFVVMDSASHALYQVVGDTGSRVLVVELRMKVINTSEPDTGYALVQMQLHEETSAIRIVYGNTLDTRIPLGYQLGFAASTSDVAFIDVDSNQLIFANTTSQLNDTNCRPEQWRWYQIEHDSNYCYHYSTPWGENFNTDHFMSCWTMLDYDASTYTRWVRSSGAMWAYRDNRPCNDWLVTPRVQLPDSGDGLQLMYDYKATSSSGDFGEMEVRLAFYYPGDSNTTVDTMDFYTFLRTESEGTDNVFQPRGISLDDFAGMQVRIAFVHVRLHSNSNIYVDNVQIVRTTTPSVTIEAPSRAYAYDTAQASAMLLAGSPQGLIYDWHSSMATHGMATFTSDGPYLYIVYTHQGTDTLTCIASNAYGSDTTTKVVDVRDCTTVTEYPWWEDFEHGLACWHQLGGWTATGSYGSYEGGTALRSNSTQEYHETSTSSFWIMSQPFVLDTATLTMPTLLWWMRTLSQEEDSHNEFSVRIAVVDSTEIPAVADFTTVYSRTMYYGDWEHYQLSLEAYAGQTIRIMFRNVPSHSGYGYYDCVLIDQVEVRSSAAPVVELHAPLRVERLDSNLFTAHLEEGDTTGLTYTWHSTMADDTLASFTFNDTLLHISYTAEGIDTITVIATNLCGSDTATVIVSVYNCPALGLPLRLYFEDSTDLNCWSGFVANGNNDARVSYGTPWYRAGDSVNHYMTSNANRGWLVTPAIDLPTDTSDLNLHWYQNNSSSFLGVFLSTDSSRYFEPADFNHTIQSFNDNSSNTNGHHTYSLAAFAGRRIRIGFVNAYSPPAIQLDSICIAPNLNPPTATLTAPSTASAGNRITVTATVGPTQLGLTHRWHSTMASAGLARMTPADTLLRVYYLDGGMDTITYIVSHLHGADTQQVVVAVDACNTYAVPYTQDFDSTTGAAMWSLGSLPECWIYRWNGNDQYAPHVLVTASAQQYVPHTSQVLFMMAATQSGFDTVAYAVLPRFAVGLQHLSIALTHVHEYMNIGTLTVGYMSDTVFVPIADLPATMDSNGRRDTVSFASVPDSATHMALRWKYNLNMWFSVVVDDIEVFVPTAVGNPPVVAVTAPSTVRTREAATFTAQLLSGDTTGLAFQWSSTLADAGGATFTAADTLCAIVYSVGGIDTVTLVASNAFGSDTQRAVVQVWAYYQVAATSADSTMGYVSGSGLYREGDTATLVATAYEGYHFAHWNDDDTMPVRQVVVVSDTTFTAYFEASPVYFTLTATSADGTMGSVSGGGTYLEGDTATVVATAYEGYHFVQWNDGDTMPMRRVVVVSDTTFTAYFEADPAYFTLTVTSADGTMGSVSGGGTYLEGDTATVVATAYEGYHFAHWNDSDTLPVRRVVVVSDTTFTAYFEADTQGVGIHSPLPSTLNIPFTLYPNPTTGIVRVDLPSATLSAILTVVDMTGRIVKKALLSQQHTLLDVSHLPAGTYYVRVNTAESIGIKKLTIR